MQKPIHEEEFQGLTIKIYSDEHLELHIKEGYYPSALIYNAVKAKGYPHPEVILHMNCQTSIKCALRSYLKKRLMPSLAS